MARTWFGLNKVCEEMCELGVELNKLQVFPTGKHPGRKRNLVVSTEEECADVLAAVEFFIERNALDRKKIERRKKMKFKKFCGWWGSPKSAVVAMPPKQKPLKKQPKKVRKDAA
jgi:NTP pyrophosphatase (non-canonical NTP hydrolase)